MSDTNLNDASFTPEIQDSEESTNKQTYSATGSFRFWCQKVLPLVYDDSLSYYELLCKVVNYLNNVIQNVDNLNTSVDNTNTAFDNLQDYVNATKDALIIAYGELEQYVNDYFNNLDVQEEINAKLDVMASDGSLNNVVSPFIPSAVSDWLSDNITPTSPAIDASLSISGAGADAKVTGDFIEADRTQIADVKSALNSVTNSIETGASVHYIDGTFSGTGYAELRKSLKAGTYKYSLDGVTSSDTDTSVSCIDFYSGTTKKATIAVYRNVASSGTVNIPADVDVVYFYASDNNGHSTGDTFTYHNFVLFKNNKLVDDIEALTSDIEALEEQDTAIESELENIKDVSQDYLINQTVSGTTYEEIIKTFKAGTYIISVDNVVSSDTDSSYSVIDFYNSSSTKVGSITLERGHNSEWTVTLSADASVAYFYASDNNNHSTGDTFTYTNVKLYQSTKLVDNIETLHKTALDVNSAIISPTVVVSPTWVNRPIIDSSGKVSIYANTQYASTEDIISVVGYNKVNIVVGASELTGVKVYKYDLNGNFLGYNWGTSIVAFTYTIPDGVYGIRIEYSKDSAIDLSTIGTVTLYRVNPSIPHNIIGKKFVYDGDSIAESRLTGYANGGAYAKLIANLTNGTYVNQSVGGGHISSTVNNPYYSETSVHSVVDNITNLPTDGDLYCFEGGINDYWANIPLGTVSDTDYTGSLDINTVAGALEYIFRYAINNFVGKPIIFVIVHKIQTTFITKNARGDTFTDFHDMFVRICNKYSIPYYDAFLHSCLNGWNTVQSNNFLTAGVHGSDGTHPNEAGYERYYVPQLIDLFSANLKY